VIFRELYNLGKDNTYAVKHFNINQTSKRPLHISTKYVCGMTILP